MDDSSYESLINSTTNSSIVGNNSSSITMNRTPNVLNNDYEDNGRYNWMDYDSIRDPMYVVVPISVIYATIFVTGIIGNVSTCVVIARNKSMHTATNYYLCSLAISDLLLLVLGMPVEIYQVWYKYPYVFGEAFCVLRGLGAETSANASVLTITAFTAERYVAICHPFLSQTMSKLSRAVKLILFIWLVALISAVPQAVQFGLVTLPHRPDLRVCSLKHVIFENSFVVASIVFFVVPFVLLSVLYVMIGIKLKTTTIAKKCRARHSQLPKRTSSTRVKLGSSRMDKHCMQHHTKSTKRVIKMLVAVVLSFFICWLPFHVQRLVATLEKQQQQSQEINERMALLYVISTYVSGILYYFSTTINPILYNIMSNKFREAFMETLAKSCRISRYVRPRDRCSYLSLSRSQQRNPGTYLSKTTGLSLGTALAQESTDCSGNSFRDEFHQVDFSTSDSPPSAIYPGNCKESFRRDGTNIEMDSYNGSSLNSRAFSGPFKQQCHSNAFSYSISKELPKTEHDLNLGLNGSTVRQSHSCNAIYRVKPADNKKKILWNLFNWLPGLKRIKASRNISRQSQDIVVDLDRRNQLSSDFYVDLHTFKQKDESCRPV